MEENRFLKQAKEELAYLSDALDFQLIVDSIVRMLRDIYSFQKQCEREANEKVEKQKEKELREKEEQVKTEEREENKKEIVKKMKNKNISIDEISELTGLTEEEIEKYKW